MHCGPLLYATYQVAVLLVNPHVIVVEHSAWVAVLVVLVAGHEVLSELFLVPLGL